MDFLNTLLFIRSLEVLKSYQMWTNEFGNVWLPLKEKEIAVLRDYQVTDLVNPLWPRLRAVVAQSYEPWIIVIDFNKTYSTEVLCGLSGKYGYRYVSIDSNETVPICAYGAAIDILKRMEEKLEFVGEVHVSRDGLYGSYDEKTNTATGIIREISQDEADIAMDLSEESGRNKVVHFSTHFAVGGNGIAYIQSNNYRSAGLFGPFSGFLWAAIVLGIVGLMIFIWCIERISPYGEYKLKQRNISGTIESFDASESMNYLWGIFLSGEIIVRKPVTVASHVSLIIFAIVSILILAAYSGNLITFLVVVDETPLITGLYDPKVSLLLCRCCSQEQ